jgi:hypothetical protein
VADEQHRAGIVAEHVLQHVERLDVEVVGRLVQHQDVRGRLRQGPRQHQPAALAAREGARRRARLFRGLNRKSFM